VCVLCVCSVCMVCVYVCVWRGMDEVFFLVPVDIIFDLVCVTFITCELIFLH
jgi:hypothetical protein